MSDTSNGPAAFKAEITVFILVKTQPEWLALSVDQRFEQVGLHVAPVLKKHAEKVRLRFYDVEFDSARVTDIWVWEAADHHAYQLLIEDLQTPMRPITIGRQSGPDDHPACGGRSAARPATAMAAISRPSSVMAANSTTPRRGRSSLRAERS